MGGEGRFEASVCDHRASLHSERHAPVASLAVPESRGDQNANRRRRCHAFGGEVVWSL
jgi:hypothetical protein